MILYLLETVNPPGTMLHLDSELLIELGIQWVNTILLTLILAKLLYKPVKNFLDARANRIAAQIVSANEVETTALSLKKEYENKMQTIETERIEILDTTRKRAVEKSEEILSEAKLEATRIRDRALNEINLEQEKARDEMRQTIIKLSTLLAGRFVSLSLDKKTQDRLINETVMSLEDVKWLG